MSGVSAVTDVATRPGVAGPRDAFENLDIKMFLDLMIAELQNQDPLNPMENDELVAQISQIREVSATDKLTKTLNSVLLGQNIASAANLIGADVEALSDDGQRVYGSVRSVSINDGEPKLELAVGVDARPTNESGAVEDGKYLYEIVWHDDKGTAFSTQVSAETSTEEEFQGAIELRNLPTTKGPKTIYRTDRSGEGDLKLVGTIPTGSTINFLDTTADAGRTEVLSGERQTLTYARKVSARLSNVGLIRPPDM